MNYLLKIPANFRGTYPLAGKAFIGGSLVALALSGYSWLESSSAQRELEWRKNQLSLPVYRLSEEEHINPPWNNDNINEWLYRRGIFMGYFQLRSAEDHSIDLPVVYHG